LDSREVNLKSFKKTKSGRGGRPPKYSKKVSAAVEQLWRLFGYLCGKRLVVVIRFALPELRDSSKFIHFSTDVVDSLKAISASTIDRMLKKPRAALRLKGTSYTRGTAALSNQIPIRTFGEWQGVAPGHIQIDLVGHDGGIATGQCCFTLTATDVCLGWTERGAVLNRASKWVEEALADIRTAFPFPLIEIHPDNGSEFINHSLLKYCKDTDLAMSRSRSGRKNDNCYVEQKNFDTVRKLVGYARFTTPETVEVLNRLYRVQGLLQNYIFPSQKLIDKTRRGAKVTKRYDKPQSPADRLLANPGIDKKVKAHVRSIRRKLSPIELSIEVKRLQKALEMLSVRNPSTAYPEGSSA
jgi:hypothetical protein